MPLVSSGVEKGNLRELSLARMDELVLNNINRVLFVEMLEQEKLV